MRVYRLKELLTIKNGRDQKSLRKGNIPVYGSGGIISYGDCAIFRDESILLPRKGSLANIQYVDKPFWTVDTIYYTIIDKDIVIPIYLFYLLRLMDLSRLNTGTGVPSMTFESYYNIEIPLPSIGVQKKIASILSSLDAKIELNNRINTELEAMAKALYDYWFVQFDFPDDRGLPYRSSGGRMVWNEELKREVPEGWEVKELEQIITLEYGKPLKEEERTGQGYPVMGSNGIVGYHKDYLIEGPGIVVGRKGTAGAVVWINDNYFPIDTTFYVKDKLGLKSLCFHYFLLLYSKLKQFESSSAVPGLNRNFAYSIKVLVPPVNIIENYNEITSSFFSKIKSYQSQNRQLSSLRDWLLPMLMNGQVRVV
jgi:type I restriction enzyme S subunit